MQTKLVSMKRCFAVLFIFFALADMIMAQPGQLIIKGYGKDLHLDHRVAPKEGLFAIGRLYNVHPKTIAAYNNLDMSKGLSLGQMLHIPLTDTNFSQKTNKGTPIYYKVGEKETLLKVSNVNNNVTMQTLREWNKLANDNLTAGKKLIVGFLISSESPAITVAAPVKEEPKKIITDKPVVKTEPIKEEPKKKTEDKPVVKTETVKEKPPVKSEEVMDKPTIRKEDTPEKNAVIKPQVTADMTGQGYFKSSFYQQVRGTPISKTETVTAGTFKMVYGPEEAKYYLLADGVPSGTIVRIINPENSKAVYAKVLGEMGGIRQNQGLNIRISNAAAASLGITETDKFIVKINY